MMPKFSAEDIARHARELEASYVRYPHRRPKAPPVPFVAKPARVLTKREEVIHAVVMWGIILGLLVYFVAPHWDIFLLIVFFILYWAVILIFWILVGCVILVILRGIVRYLIK